MSGLFGTLGTATSGITANQVALQTTAHNIANTNTDGYSRQRVHMTTKPPYVIAGTGTIGTGVNVTGVERVVDDFVRSQIREANSKYTYNTQKSDTLGQLEDILHEPSNDGVIKALNTLTDSWQKLAENPELGTSKTLVVENANSFADSIHQMATQINQLYKDSISNLQKSVLDFNEKIDQLADINKKVFTLTSRGETPNDLLDQRDTLLKDISGLVNINTEFDGYGRTTLSVDGQTILDFKNETHNTLSVVVGTDANGNALVSDRGDSSKSNVALGRQAEVGTVMLTKKDDAGNTAYSEIKTSEGDMGGYQESAKEILEHLDELNDFIAKIGKVTNMVMTGGQNKLDGFFTLGNDPSRYALDFKVNDAIAKDPSKIPAGKALDGTGSAGDGSRALAVSWAMKTKFKTPVRDADLDAYNESTMKFNESQDGQTFAETFNNIVTKNGISKQKADNMAAAQKVVLNNLENKNESISGVNINEEMSDVIKFQQGFQANTRVLSVIAEMLDTLVNKTGV
ncbi:flagellar hook-associated protein FlgK [Ligilactobacillus ruminis]|uniref:Flagellar hook-associated protein 1 n=1 Tax=Ligilactobacillus ruminis (strain ATCC 27782 / RF3) TaxID=1069534 RepID=G2SRG0_LIGR2|nr:flagellar hook-associated protein FlgK [Ligilactobacillus ruminis]AEN78819.1 Flagellar hook associated protein [Ligilactobacillus ruminis ATCC 27782]AJA34227.1 flagellar hook-associated protein 1 FlgK [Ligilactobacillus ruminis ATCC 27782]